jgi:hypothetical protein
MYIHTRAPLWIKLSLVRVPLQCTKHDSCIYLLFFFFKHGGCFSLCVGYGAYGLFWPRAQFSIFSFFFQARWLLLVMCGVRLTAHMVYFGEVHNSVCGMESLF